MQLNKKQNSLLLSGNIAKVDIRIGQYGPFGHITIASDDGYRDPKQNNAWVERTQFIYCKISGNNLPVINAGDFILIRGKIIAENWDDNGVPKSAMKVEVLEILDHMPKEANEALKQAGLSGKQLMQPKPPQGSQQQRPQQPQGSQQPRPQQPQGSQQQRPQHPQGGGAPDYQGDGYGTDWRNQSPQHQHQGRNAPTR
jgi:single-stranded DNA-binding protein